MLKSFIFLAIARVVKGQTWIFCRFAGFLGLELLQEALVSPRKRRREEQCNQFKENCPVATEFCKVQLHTELSSVEMTSKKIVHWQGESECHPCTAPHQLFMSCPIPSTHRWQSTILLSRIIVVQDFLCVAMKDLQMSWSQACSSGKSFMEIGVDEVFWHEERGWGTKNKKNSEFQDRFDGNPHFDLQLQPCRATLPSPRRLGLGSTPCHHHDRVVPKSRDSRVVQIGKKMRAKPPGAFFMSVPTRCPWLFCCWMIIKTKAAPLDAVHVKQMHFWVSFCVGGSQTFVCAALHKTLNRELAHLLWKKFQHCMNVACFQSLWWMGSVQHWVKWFGNPLTQSSNVSCRETGLDKGCLLDSTGPAITHIKFFLIKSSSTELGKNCHTVHRAWNVGSWNCGFLHNCSWVHSLVQVPPPNMAVKTWDQSPASHQSQFAILPTTSSDHHHWNLSVCGLVLVWARVSAPFIIPNVKLCWSLRKSFHLVPTLSRHSWKTFPSKGLWTMVFGSKKQNEQRDQRQMQASREWTWSSSALLECEHCLCEDLVTGLCLHNLGSRSQSWSRFIRGIQNLLSLLTHPNDCCTCAWDRRTLPKIDMACQVNAPETREHRKSPKNTSQDQPIKSGEITGVQLNFHLRVNEKFTQGNDILLVKWNFIRAYEESIDWVSLVGACGASAEAKNWRWETMSVDAEQQHCQSTQS